MYAKAITLVVSKEELHHITNGLNRCMDAAWKTATWLQMREQDVDAQQYKLAAGEIGELKHYIINQFMKGEEVQSERVPKDEVEAQAVNA